MLSVDPAAATPSRPTGQEGHAVRDTQSGLWLAGWDRAPVAQAARALPHHQT